MPPSQATRATGEALLDAFTPRMGDVYAQGRNIDRGPGAHRDVSQLSPYLRRRLVLEQEAVSRAISEHGVQAAERFVQEVFWRGYFKGWLEHRPGVWAQYRDGLREDLAALDAAAERQQALERATRGKTGLECFDAWVSELRETGYLHNHARMWFASIWIFTLQLPWRLGADFFYRHLLDGDPASNTLSWRWVAGLHTRGKPYAAQADNIARLSAGRFQPAETDLAQDIQGLEDQEPQGLPELQPLRAVSPPDPQSPTALLITEEDCRVEDFALNEMDIRCTATLAASPLRSPGEVSRDVAAFEARALDDAARRTGYTATPLQATHVASLVTWAHQSGVRQIVTPYIPTGPLRDWFDQAEPALAEAGIALNEWQRNWDSATWPHATAGYFKLKKRIPQILQQTGLT
ncbi:FAD-binding domain-containing protein [Halomonas almeriensis]|uniref:FAD-binding domain-containing protein n=1 Tax=Halomonas almeriensis TaxID=308163 RepID=UPI0025B487A0|nr:FAD-binding domain-containing protein [Halomonas almeriensis]MDN3552156.1 FAD-binding domain-containing protein [Halomonas almeriensis]